MIEIILKLSEVFPRPLQIFNPQPAEEKLYGHPLGPAELKSDGWHRSFQRCQVFVSPLAALAKLNCLLFLGQSMVNHFAQAFPATQQFQAVSGGFR